uniref:Fibrinogen-like protein 1 n=1 Tax=Crassostrea virginica TaxID=6565 RepID=A0A8B8BAQ3_CRAVI|nr:fibrinogen-like protein 1 [Crassostrea virginica]
MAVIVLIVSVLLDVVLVTHGQVYVFQNIEEHEQRISFLETSISNASTCCTSLKKENDLLKNQNQQLLLMMQNLSSQVSSLQQTMGALTTVSKTTVAPPTPPPATPTTTIPVPTAPLRSSDCADWAAKGETASGIFEVDLAGTSKQVVCDFDHDGGRWTVIQRRRDASVDFNRNWTDYRDGFGDLNSEFWLGNEAIHQLTAGGNNVLNIKLMDWMGNLVYAEYTGFRLDGENMDYKLNVISFSGTAGDSFNYPQSNLLTHNNHRFSTPDHDRDNSFLNCAQILQSGWWFNSCYSSNLNGVFLKGFPHGPKQTGEVAGQPPMEGTGIEWYPWKQQQYSMSHVEMKIRPSF